MSGEDCFSGRISNHDRACAVFTMALQHRGIISVPVGLECNKNGASKLLIKYDNDMSRFMRHFPDIYVILTRDSHVLIDVKSLDNSKYKNFSIEADSLYAASQLCQLMLPVYFACVELDTQIIGMIKADLIFPPTIHVPRSHRMADMREKFPRACIEFKDRTGGSGTPYVLIPKTHCNLNTLDTFIEINQCANSKVWRPANLLEQQLLIFE